MNRSARNRKFSEVEYNRIYVFFFYLSFTYGSQRYPQNGNRIIFQRGVLILFFESVKSAFREHSPVIWKQKSLTCKKEITTYTYMRLYVVVSGNESEIEKIKIKRIAEIVDGPRIKLQDVVYALAMACFTDFSQENRVYTQLR